MSAPRPLVSVLINNYNYGRFLRDAIDSALRQSYTHTEVIVVDDGSTDDSREIIATYGSRIMPVLKENGGQASAFNAGISACTGDLICFLDADDFFSPDKAKVVAEHAERFPEAGLIAHPLEYCDGNGASVEFCPSPFTSVRLVDDRERARRGRLSIALPATSGLAIKRGLAKQIFPMPEEIVITADDYVKFASLGLAPVLSLPMCLASQRLHDNNAYTRPALTDSFKIKQALVNIKIASHLRECFPSLRRMACKQQGRAMGSLLCSKAPEARQAFRNACREFRLLDFTPSCWFWFAGAFLRSWTGRPVRLEEA